MDDHFHFIGIGGIGMSSLAMILLQKETAVSGSDVVFSSLIEKLQKKGAKVHLEHAKKNIQDTMCIVYSTAIDSENVEFVEAKKKDMKMIHRSDLLAQIMKEKKSILVTGTHGKTTVSALLSHVLYYSNYDPSFSVGGEVISLPSHGRWGKGDYFVAEADESDRSFLKLSGFGSIITNIDEDHMEYWTDLEDIKQGYKEFIEKIESTDHLFWCFEDENLKKIHPKGISYGFSSSADLCIQNFTQKNGNISFDVVFENQIYKNISLPLIGEHNALNALSVFGMCLKLKVNPEDIKKAFLTFKGIKRRCEFIGEHRKTLFFDDYAHHPTEVLSTLKAFRQKVEEKKIVVLFQPHRFSRTNYFIDKFGQCFDSADEVILTDIYSAFEKSDKKISMDIFMQNIKKRTKANVRYIPKDELIEKVSSSLRPLDVFISLGAGDVTDLGKKIFQAYQKRENKHKVALLYGGASQEHEVSCLSAKYIHQCLDTSIYDVQTFAISKEGIWSDEKSDFSPVQIEDRKQHFNQKILSSLSNCDVCIPVFHGPNGEDGMIAAFLEMISLPYVGCDFYSASLCMNKIYIKKLSLLENVMVAPFIELKDFEWNEKEKYLDEIEKNLKYPVFVKPVHLGSSIGITLVEDRSAMEKAIDTAFLYGDHVLVEEKVFGQEIEIAILGSDFVHVMTPGEVLTHGKFYDYDQKYIKDEIRGVTPANISDDLKEEAKKAAKRIYQIAGCKGLARVDFFVDTKKRVIFNEINPLPGFTPISLYPKMCHHDGWKEMELVDRLIISALYDKRKNKRWIKTKI